MEVESEHKQLSCQPQTITSCDRFAIDAVKRGERKTDVCRWLQISRHTLHLWLKRASNLR